MSVVEIKEIDTEARKFNMGSLYMFYIINKEQKKEFCGFWKVSGRQQFGFDTYVEFDPVSFGENDCPSGYINSGPTKILYDREKEGYIRTKNPKIYKIPEGFEVRSDNGSLIYRTLICTLDKKNI